MFRFQDFEFHGDYYFYDVENSYERYLYIRVVKT